MENVNCKVPFPPLLQNAATPAKRSGGAISGARKSFPVSVQLPSEIAPHVHTLWA